MTTQQYILTTDGDSHWFVIPADKEDEWSEYVQMASDFWDEMPENGDPPVQPDWADEVGGAPSQVKFSDYEIGG